MLTGKLTIDRDRWYSIGETCKLLDMSDKTLRKYTRSGAIEAGVHPSTGQIRYKGSKIETFYNQTI